MRVIYLVRAAQLLVTLCALSMLYSVSEFCERVQHTAAFCSTSQKKSDVTTTPSNEGIKASEILAPENENITWRHSTPEEDADLDRRNKERGWKPNKTVTAEEFVKDLPPEILQALEAAKAERKARAQQANTTSSSSSSSTEASTTTTTAHESTSTESSTVTPATSSEEAPIRKKRDVEEEARELPDNGATEAKRKTSVKKEDSSSLQEEAKEETKKPEKNPYHLLAQRTKKTDVKEEKEEEKKEEVTTPIHVEEKTVEERKEEKKPDLPSTSTTQSTTEDKKESIETTTEVVKEEVKEHKGDKVEIPTTSQPQKDHHQAPTASSEEKKQEDEHRTVKKDLGGPVKIPAEHKKDEVPPGEIAKAGSSLFPSFISSSKGKQDTAKKYLEEPASTPASLPSSTTVEAGRAKYTDDSFLREVRCVTVETRHYFGSAESEFAPHLKGLCFVGPVLVVICIYLVCTVLRTRLSNEPSSEYIDMLGCGFHFAMWLLVDLSVYFIYDDWKPNWNATTVPSFIPEFPDMWKYLIFVSAFMMSVCSLEMWFHKYLHYDLTYERSYRCYEVIEPEPSLNQEEHFARRTNVD